MVAGLGASAAGPVVAGALIALGGPAWAFAAAAVWHACAALALWSVHDPRRVQSGARGEGGPVGIWSRARDALPTGAPRTLWAASAAANAFCWPWLGLLPVIAGGAYGAGADGLAALAAASAVGMAAGAWLVGRVRTARGCSLSVGPSLAVFGAGLVAAGLAPGAVAGCAAIAAAAAGAGANGAAVQAALMLAVPRAGRSKASGLLLLSFAPMPPALLVIGIVVDASGTRPALAASGALAAVSAIAIARLLRVGPERAEG